MAGYTKINFKDVENVATNPQREVRLARSSLNSRDLGVSKFRYGPNLKSPQAHSHKVQEEVYIVVQGGGRMLLDGKAEPLVEGDLVRVAPETIRSFEAGPEGLELLIVASARPPEGDATMTEAIWPS